MISEIFNNKKWFETIYFLLTGPYSEFGILLIVAFINPSHFWGTDQVKRRLFLVSITAPLETIVIIIG